MNTPHDPEEEIFFHAAAIRSLEERTDFVAEACGADGDLRDRVMNLLRSYGKAVDQNFFPGVGAGRPLPFPGSSYDEDVGTVIGRYKLAKLVGKGGFGEVWEAEQIEPVQRIVALKIIKLGMDTHEVVTRFELERKTLALMKHPNIATVLDAGVTGTGRPFFVMESVPGIKITEFCDRARMAVRERIELFIQVCQALQHAHQKGIIHRDIKPSNVLVIEIDGKPLVKVIDFGIAKAIHGALSGGSFATQLKQMVGTPAYMSPEQSEGSPDIDTRSDIYSLGVLLYELLTGRTPIDSETLANAGLDEIRRFIRETEPPRPSACVKAMPCNDQTTVSRNRDSDPGGLSETLRDELDWIVMMPIEKERQRRYETVSALAMDLQRYLSNEPVVARPPSRIYRLKKLIRRNRLAFAAAGGAVAALVVGLAIAVWALRRETAARQQASSAEKSANSEARKSNQVAGFLGKMLKGVGPSVARGRDTKLLKEILEKTDVQVRQQLKDQPDVEADLLSIIGSVYNELGDFGKAEALKREVLRLRTTVFPTPHRKVADSINDLANVFYRQGNLDAATEWGRKALGMRRELFGKEHSDVAASLNNLANVLRTQGNLKEAEEMNRKALAMRKKLFGNHHEEVAESLDNLGGVLSLRRKFVEAEAMQREALALNRELLRDKHPDVAISLNNLADTLYASGKLDEAETFCRQVLAMRIELFSAEHPDVASSMFLLATLLVDQGKLPEAESVHRDALAMRRKLLGSSHLDVAGSLNNLAALLIKTGKFDEADTVLDEALVIQRKQLPLTHRDILGTIQNKIVSMRERTRKALLNGVK